MSKNTERGIGHHVGPVADGRPDDTRPRQASETSTVGPPPEGGDRDRDSRAPKVEVSQITLLGVPAPDLDREKATTPGRDVHLPTEVRRVAAPRAVAADAGPVSPARDPRKTPEGPRPRIAAASAPSIPLNTRDVMSSVNARLSETGEVPNAALRSAGRRDFAETTLMEAIPETGRGASIALGIALSLVAAVVIVWTLRFGPHLHGFEAAFAERPVPTSEPRRPVEAAPPSRDTRLPVLRSGTSPPVEGEPAASNSVPGAAARGVPSPEGSAAARAAPFEDQPPAARGSPESGSRESRFGAGAAGAATEEEGRRKNQRIRTSASGERTGDRSGSSATAPRRWLPPPVFPPASPPAPPSIVRSGDAPDRSSTSPPSVGSGRAASSEPPRFEPPPPPPARPAPTNEKQYDPDSPLPPAAGE